jgi:hypothetical protein
MQDTDLSLKITPPNVPQAFMLGDMGNTWNVQPTNQLAAEAYSEEDYHKQAEVAVAAGVIRSAFLAMIFLTIAYRKFIGLELATLIQLGYLSLLQNREITAYAEPIAAWRYVFGYNEVYFSPWPKERFMFPYSIYRYQPHLGYSNNLMIFIAYGLYALALITLLVSRLAQKGTRWRIARVAFILATDVCYSVVVYLSPNIFSAICIEIREGDILNWNLAWSDCLLVLSLFVFLLAHVVNTVTATRSRDLNTFFNYNKVGMYIPIVFNIRLIAITILLFAYQLSQMVPMVMIFCLQGAYILFVLICRPHLIRFDFVRSLFIELGLLCILILRQVEIRSLAGSVDSHSLWFPAWAYLEYAIYIVAIILSIVSLVINCRRIRR